MTSFFSWYHTYFSNTISTLQESSPFIPLDILAIDLMQILHHRTKPMYPNEKDSSSSSLSGSFLIKDSILIFKKIGQDIEHLCTRFSPRKYIILSIDGISEMAKYYGQRQHRYKLSSFYTHPSFDPNILSPGTVYMNQVSEYIDWYIRQQTHVEHSIFRTCKILFCNETVRGEALFKLFRILYQCSEPSDHIGIWTEQFDALLLSLIHPFSNLTILSKPHEYQCISIPSFRRALGTYLDLSSNTASSNRYMDILFLFHLVQNEFLPPLLPFQLYPSQHLEFLLDLYRKHVCSVGHTLFLFQKNEIIPSPHFYPFFQRIASFEIQLLETQYTQRDLFFPDPLLLFSLHIKDSQLKIHSFDQVKRHYYQYRIQSHSSIEELSLEYIRGLLWVLHYFYFLQPASPTWFYPELYAPFLSDLPSVLESSIRLSSLISPSSYPMSPFLQLLLTLPQSSQSLLPLPLRPIMDNFPSYFPLTFEIDMSGKKDKWEGTVLLSIMCMDKVIKSYDSKISELSSSDRARNLPGQLFLYQPTSQVSSFRSSFGTISQKVLVESVSDLSLPLKK